MGIESLVTVAKAAGFAMAPSEDVDADVPAVASPVRDWSASPWGAREVKALPAPQPATTLPALRAAVSDGRASVVRGFWGFWSGGAPA